MPGSKLRETQKPTAAIRQRTLNFRLRLNLISRLVTQSQSCEWLPKLQNPRRNQYKPSHITCVYKLYGSQTVSVSLQINHCSRGPILICTCSIICDIKKIVKTWVLDFFLSYRKQIVSGSSAQFISYSLLFLIQIPNLEISLCLPSLVFLGNILSLIIQFFSFCKTNLHFYQAPVKIHF